MKTILRILAALAAAVGLAFALADDPVLGLMIGLGCVVLLIVFAFLRFALACRPSADDDLAAWFVTLYG